ncbi:beta-lactamase regulating signal transducer with metallopeptidase domain [Gramella sp. Hel_I_59]|uniref:M56 family metallopeptidase n=1 Tax=Gramella sp. Hel_I_59 TaxID=1249978 RepID=UPI00114F8DC9|nr:M56 family metallopeptidase [Gramella sp. Hel_I_59]TQI70691.1 beta-lactamase regulating signal transducer with metallopeptidase domain [Gramella sp. Hel_I_59]
MLEYILKSAGCLLVLFAFYKFFLEAEKSNRLKRFYLIFMLLFSAILPFITISYEVAAKEFVDTAPMIVKSSEKSSAVQEVGFFDQYGSQIWLAIYFIGFLAFLLRFIWNLNKMRLTIKKGQLKKEFPYIYVLLGNSINPFSFLHYIFFSRKEFKNSQISEAVIAHEKAHVDQKHSWDLLFLELVNAIFWFNPIFIFIKKSIKLNHEFLADEQVLAKHQNLRDYSELLLGYSRGQDHNVLASPINHSLIKKRILMMTKNLSARRLSMKMLVLLPILGGCIYTFNQEIVAKPVLSIDENLELIEFQKKKSVYITVNKEDILLYDKPVSLKDFAEELDKTTKDWNDWQLKNPYFYVDFANSTTGFIEKLNAEYRKTELSRISGTEFLAPSAPETGATPPPPPPPPVQAIEGRNPASQSSNSSIGEQRDNLFSIQVAGSTLRVNGVKTNPGKLSETLDKLSEGITDEELKIYNFRMQVIDPASGYMESLNSEFRKSRMSKVSGHDILPPPPPVHRGEDHQVPKPPKPPKSTKPQKAPKPPKPPKRPKAAKTGEFVTGEEELLANESLEVNYIKEEMDSKDQKLKNKSKVKDKNKQNSVPNPPAPPAAPDPLKTIKVINAEGGIFFYNGKKISAKKATKIIESKNYTKIVVNQTGDSEGFMKITGSR